MLMPEFINTPGGAYKPLPPEIDRAAIYKIDPQTLRQWAKTYGWTALNRRLSELDVNKQ
jgi:hypothetical protein